ncbi:TonB-dependent receptor [Porphyromonadaceae bacterium W3.11]|nr:TonB-dependent receptor [Porphyromonadaceae bacterium W3.11]
MITKRKLVAILFALTALLALPMTAFAEGDKNLTKDNETNVPTGNISGVVVDQSGGVLPGAVLRLDRENRYTVADLNGQFVFLAVPVGTYTLTVDYIGFETFTKSVTVERGKATDIHVMLKDKVFTTGEVVVIGELAKGQARALNTERSNTNITNMVSADHIGRFPDSNVGDALKRIPGITMQNDQGEARNIVLRGLASNLNSVTLNGGRIPSAEGDNRNVQMDLIPCDLISMIEVNKTLLPDMEADAIGGSVNLVTKVAPRHQRISGSISGGYNPIRNTGTGKMDFTYGNRFVNDQLGMVFSLSYHNRDYGSDNIEAAWVEKDGEVYMEDFQIRKYDVQRIRRSASLNFDYQFNKNQTLYLKTLATWRDDRENRYRFRMNKMKPIGGGLFEGRIDRETKGGIDSNRNKNRRLEDQRIYDITLGGEHLLGSNVELDWKGSYSRASEHRPNERYFVMRAKDVIAGQDLSDGVYPKLIDISANLDDFKSKTISEEEQMTYENQYGAAANFRVPLSIIDQQKGRLRLGAKLSIKNKDRNNSYNEYEPIEGDLKFANLKQVNWDDTKFLNSKGYTPGAFVSNKYLGGMDLNNSSKYEREDVLEEYWTKNYEATENIYAAYLRWDQNINEDLLIIAGLRMEHTTVKYLGHTLIDDEKGPDQEDTYNYTNFFPNLTFRYQPMKPLVLRAAYSTSIARPNYYWLVPYLNIGTSDTKIQSGNAELKSTYAHNFDIIASYYPGNVGSFSVGLFYKKMNDFIYKYRTKGYTKESFAEEFPQMSNPIPDGERWEYSTYRNGSKVDLYGVEISFNRQLDFLSSTFLRRFSIYLNYTYTHSAAKGITTEDGDERTDVALPGSAPHTGNASLAYEDKKLTARISFNFAAAYLDELGSEAFEDAYYGAQTFLDFNASYKFGKKLQLFVDCNNLLNTPLFYYQGQKDRLMQLEFYKPTFKAGLRFNL